MAKTPQALGAVLISGASTGIGYDIARRLDRMGFDVFAGVRRESDADRLRAGASPRLQPVMLDVTRPDQVEGAVAMVTARTGDAGLAALVNNAGVPVTGPSEYLAVQRWRDAFEVNFFGAVGLTAAALPALRRSRGRIVNMSSLAGRVALPFFGPYTASKHAMEAWSDSLRVELQPWGLHVTLVEPGSIVTPIWDKGEQQARAEIAGLPAEAQAHYGAIADEMISNAIELGSKGAKPSAVTKAVVHALTARRPRTRYVVGTDARVAIRLSRLLPDGPRDRVVARLAKFPGRDSRV
jgi:NAD(P)-dependent dehydrogenase (short-subunit alcohol dehydrogenase family)